jgi:cardiolipin synthase
MEWHIKLGQWWHYAAAGLSLLLSLVASAHVLIYKRDPRAAAGWIGFIWFAPVLGPILYGLFGVNRIRRRALSLRSQRERYRAELALSGRELEPEGITMPGEVGDFAAIAGVNNQTQARSLLKGNRIDPLINGDEAYPAMLQAIGEAKHSVTLSTYIFDRDDAGKAFVTALAAAVRRGVEVRVLIDATGTRYSWPSVLGLLRSERVPYARFLPAFPLWSLFSINLRNHRKLLVVDGVIGFTGGMNIRVGNLISKRPSHPVHDLHFRVTGPVVAHLQEVFAEDWHFTTGELLVGDLWFPSLSTAGSVLARGIADGPDEDVDPLRWAILAGLSAARESVCIATPYFLPDAPIISALNLAAMRGVVIDIVLPEHGNLPFVQWASRASWWQVLERGCRIWLTPGPFDHSKMLVVDGQWTLLGSANWDPRSLRLNFEFNLECYDSELAKRLEAWFRSKREASRRVTLEAVDARGIPAKLRDGAARLFSPYL